MGVLFHFLGSQHTDRLQSIFSSRGTHGLIKSGHAFFIASLAMRGLTAVGEAAMNSAVLPLARKRGGLGRECSVLSWMETMNGVGTTFGPFIGGLLFDCGGFPLPFIVSGSLLVFCAFAAAIVLDPTEEL